MYLLLNIIQVRYRTSNINSYTRVHLHVSMYGNSIVICIRLASTLRHFQYTYYTICAMVKVYYPLIQVSYPDPLHPIFLDLINLFQFCGYYFNINGMNLYVPIFGSYLHWLVLCLNSIYNIIKIMEELRALFN